MMKLILWYYCPETYKMKEESFDTALIPRVGDDILMSPNSKGYRRTLKVESVRYDFMETKVFVTLYD